MNILVIGTCQIERLVPGGLRAGHSVDEIPLNHMQFPTLHPVTKQYDAILLGINLRHLLTDANNRNMDLMFAREEWTASYAQETVDRVATLLKVCVQNVTDIANGIPVFALSFPEPSFSYLGGLVKNFGLDDPTMFFRELNRQLALATNPSSNSYFLDMNEVMHRIGTKHLHDDVITHATHAAFIQDYDVSVDANRIVPPVPNKEHYNYDQSLIELQDSLFATLANKLAILKRQDVVKLIIVDLDDTLWRGRPADGEYDIHYAREGWPLGFAEALLFFKKRGGMLAICSKNDYEETVKHFENIWGNGLTLNDFVSVKVNWQEKPKNVLEIINETNVLPSQVLFIDDNPRELDEVATMIPEIRVLRDRHYDWRKIILQSVATQVPFITEESSVRTELTKAAIERKKLNAGSREEWLTSLNLVATVQQINNVNEVVFPRILELVNKTNQFNTTGKRWTIKEFENLFRSGGSCITMSVKDRLVDNGMVGVCILQDDTIIQAILSCRVIGLDVEYGMGSVATNLLLERYGIAKASDHEFFKNMGYANGQTFERFFPPPWVKIAV